MHRESPNSARFVADPYAMSREVGFSNQFVHGHTAGFPFRGEWVSSYRQIIASGVFDPIVCGNFYYVEPGVLPVDSYVHRQRWYLTNEARDAMLDKLGDVLWYGARLVSELGVDLAWVAQNNQSKLLSRKDRGKLGGSGDNR